MGHSNVPPIPPKPYLSESDEERYNKWQELMQHEKDGMDPWDHKPKSSDDDEHEPPWPSQKSHFEPPNHDATSSNFTVPIYIAILVICILIFLAVFSFCFYKRRKRLEYKRRVLATKGVNIVGNHYLHPENINRSRGSTDLWEIRRENVIVNYENKLGSGAFADVYVGEIVGDSGIKRVYNDVLLLGNFHDCEVAVKMLPPFADETSKNDFQKEINFMKSLKYHPHLVCLIGYVPDALSPMLLIEYCSNGDLLHFVRNNKNQIVHGNEVQANLKVKNLVSFAWQISNGLEYLTSIGFIHRDVAARNVLLDKNNLCKIGDFGLCRIADNQIYTTRNGRLPVRWMAIESLRSFEYSMKTDVWAYGVLLFELFSFGDTPYAGLENSQILDFLESGNRLHRPEYCTEDIYELMQNCWQLLPSDRRSFAEICLFLMRVLENANSDYGYIEAVERSEIQIIEEDGGISVI